MPHLLSRLKLSVSILFNFITTFPPEARYGDNLRQNQGHHQTLLFVRLELWLEIFRRIGGLGGSHCLVWRLHGELDWLKIICWTKHRRGLSSTQLGSLVHCAVHQTAVSEHMKGQRVRFTAKRNVYRARSARTGPSDTANLFHLYISWSKTEKKQLRYRDESTQGCHFLVQKQVLALGERQSPPACSRTFSGPSRVAAFSHSCPLTTAAVTRQLDSGSPIWY